MYRPSVMANSQSRSGGGLNRAALKPGSSRPQAPREAPAAPVRAAATLPGRVAPPAPSMLGETLQIIGGVAITLAGIALLLGVLHLIRDSVAVGKHLADAKGQRSSLICQDGRMARGDGSLRDIILEDAYFVCTDWRTLQSIELEESKGR